jgi:hypothetical protein
MATLQIDHAGRNSLSRARKGKEVTFNCGTLGLGLFDQSVTLDIKEKRVDTTRNGGPICHIGGFLVGEDRWVNIRVYRGYKSALLFVG